MTDQPTATQATASKRFLSRRDEIQTWFDDRTWSLSGDTSTYAPQDTDVPDDECKAEQQAGGRCRAKTVLFPTSTDDISAILGDLPPGTPVSVVCGGHSSSATEASYHYHVPPVCLLHQLGAAEGAPSPQVGWMLDGFPIYGPLGPGGTAMKTCTVTGGTFGVDDCTDDCGGYYGDTGDGFMYRYYFLGEYNDGACCTAPIDPQNGGGADYYPFTPACMNGCCPSGAWCSYGIPSCDGDAVDGTAAGFAPVAIGALATNTEACANDDVCCDFDVNSGTCSHVTGSSAGASKGNRHSLNI